MPKNANVHIIFLHHEIAFPGASEGNMSACNVGDPGLTPGWGRSPGEGNGNVFKRFLWRNRIEAQG